MRQGRSLVRGLSIGAASIGMALTLAACTTAKKTLDFSPDPELSRQGAYPNINIGGAPQPGKPLTPDEQEQAKDALKAQGVVASPDIAAEAKKEGAASAADLDTLAKTHAATTLKEIQNGCGTQTVIDATKCPQ